MPWELQALAVDDHSPLGTLEQVQAKLRAAVPEIELFQDASGAEKIAAMESQGIQIPDVIREHWFRSNGAYQGLVKDKGYTIEFHLGHDQTTVSSIGINVRGNGNPMPTLQLLMKIDGWKIVDAQREPLTTDSWVMSVQFDDAIARLEAHHDQPASPAFRRVLADLRTLAEAGHVDAAHALADELATRGANHDPESAYKWYYISLSQQGYTVGWEDHNHTPPYYCGPDGDFRNESMVSELVIKLGWDRIRQLDQEATKWLADRRGI
jgi:hypothetical protein